MRFKATADVPAPLICGRFHFQRCVTKKPGISPGPSLFLAGAEGLEVHPAAAHAAHSAAARHTAALALLLRNLGDHRLGGDQQASDRRRALDRRTHDLGRVDDALADEIAVLASLRVEAPVVLVLLQDLADNDRTVFAGIGGDLHPLEGFGGAQKRDAAARQDAFLDRGAGGMHRVIDAILALLYLDLGGAADADHCNAAGELRQTFLQFLLVVVRGCFLDLRLDLRHARLDLGLLAGAVDDGGVFLVDHHLLGAAQHVDGDVLELDAEIFRDRLAAGQDGDVLQHGLAAIAEARSLDGRNLEAATQAVDDEGGEGFAFDVFRDDNQRLAGLHHGFEQRQQLVEVGELLLVDQDVGVVEFDAHLVGVGAEVGRDVAAVELQAFDDIEFGFQRLGFLNRNDALVADLLHGIGKELADFCIAVGGDGADLGDFLVRGDLLGVLDEVGDHGFHSQIDTALQIHRVHAGSNRLGAFAHNCRGQHSCGGGAVAGSIGRLGGDFAYHLGAHVLELVLKLDFLGDGDAVLGDAGCAERLVEQDVAALVAERQ